MGEVSAGSQADERPRREQNSPGAHHPLDGEVERAFNEFCDATWLSYQPVLGVR